MPSFMSREIGEQPRAVRETLLRVEAMGPALGGLGAERFEKVLFIARGTSDNVAAYGTFLIPVLTGIECYSISPSLLNGYEIAPDLSRTLVIAISQSGETMEIVTATRRAKSLGAVTLAITNTPSSSLEGVTDLCLVTPAGVERAVPATKTYTTALVGLAAIVAEVFARPELNDQLATVPGIMEAQLAGLEMPQEVIELLGNAQTAVFAGRGLALGAVFEAALKLKETCAINAIGTSVADLVHGPIAALSPSVPLLIFSAGADSPIYPGLVDLAERARATGSPVVTVGDFLFGDQAQLHVGIEQRAGQEMIAPLRLAIPSQRLAQLVSEYRGLNPDAPAVLNKVTQTA